MESSQLEIAPCRANTEVLITLNSLSGSLLCTISLASGDSLFVLQEAAAAALPDASANRIRLVRHGELLHGQQTAAAAGLCDGDVLTAILADHFQFGRCSESCGEVCGEGGRSWTRVSNDKRFSVALGRTACDSGSHTWTLRKAAGNGTGCALGVCATDIGLDFHPVVDMTREGGYCAFYRTSCNDAGGLRTSEAIVQESGLPSLQVPGATVEITLDCEEHTLTFRVKALEERWDETEATISGLQAIPLHLFIGIDDLGDTWEVLE